MKPIISSQIPAFDATIDYSIPFTYTGNIPYQNRILILNAKTNVVVYDNTVSSMLYSHTIPANTLKNGGKYTVQIQTFDKNEVASELSSKAIIFCYSTPTFEFESIEDESLVTTATITPSIYYYQTEGETLSQLKVVLYDSNNNIVYDTGVLYNNSSIPTIGGLEDRSDYSIQATGTTSKNMSLDTGLISFTTRFDITPIPTLLECENLPKEGIIKLTCNIKTVNIQTGDELIYIDNEEVDLRDNWILYEDVKIDDDFTFELIGRDFTSGQEVISFTDDDFTGYVSYHETIDYSNDENLLGYFMLKVTGIGGNNYFLFTNFFNVQESTVQIKIFLRKENNYYDLSAVIGEEVY